MPDNTWQIVLDDTGEMRRVSAEGRLTAQPLQNFWRMIQNGIFGLLSVERHL